MVDTHSRGLHEDWHALWGKEKKWGSILVLKLEWMLCQEWDMTLNSVGIHPLMSSHKYQHNHRSHCSSWIMSEDLLSEGGWHTIGTLGDNPNSSKEPMGNVEWW